MVEVLHNYWKIAWFEGRQDELSKILWPQLISELKGMLGETENTTKLKLIGDTYHVVGCSSPEYNCYPPFQDRMCHTEQVRNRVHRDNEALLAQSYLVKRAFASPNSG